MFNKVLEKSIFKNRISGTTFSIASNTFYQLIGKAVSMGITILATILITRIYGREAYGQFNLMQTFPALFYIIVDFGINAIASREISKDWSKAQKYYSTILTIRILLSCVIIILSYAILMFMPYSDFLRVGIYLSMFLVFTQAIFATTNIIFQVKLRYDFSTIGYVVGNIFILALVLWFSYTRSDIRLVSLSYVFGGFITFLLNARYVQKLGVKTQLKYDKDIAKYLLGASLPLGLMFIFSQVNFKADSIFISVLDLPQNLGLNNNESVAVYGLPYKIFEVALVVPTFFMNAAYPVLVRHYKESKDKLKETLQKVVKSLGIIGIIFGVTGYIFAPLIIHLLGGEGFERSVDVLRILLGGIVVFYVSQPVSWLIVILDKQKYLPYVYLFGAILNVTLNLLLIPRYSFYASSVITLVSESLILVALLLIARYVWTKENI